MTGRLLNITLEITINLVMQCLAVFLTSFDGSWVQVARFKQLTLYLQAPQLAS